MTIPRCHEPNQVSDEIRDTSNLASYFDTSQKEVHRYCLAQASSSHEQEIVAAVVLPWRVREIVHDLAGTRSEFNRHYHSLMTHFARRHRGPIDHVWSNGRPDEQVVVGRDPKKPPPFEESIKAVVECVLEPVRAGLCKDPKDYDGLIVLPKHWGQEFVVARPEIVSERTTLPRTASFTPRPPPGADHMTLEQKIEFAEREIAKALPEALAEGRLARKRKRKRIRHRKPRPNFRGDPAGVKLAEEEYEAWQKFYHECRRQFREDQTVVFPVGTVRFRMLGAICDPNPITRCL